MLPLPNWDFTILPHLFQQWTHITLTMDRRLLINTRYFLCTVEGVSMSGWTERQMASYPHSACVAGNKNINRQFDPEMLRP